MQFSPPSITSRAGRARAGNSGSPTFSKILHLGFFCLAVLLGLIPASYGQEERPQIIPGERKNQRKKDVGPRAVAVLQLAPNGKASLVPIAILINGKFWDATVYKADPIPMALDPGNVYEVEQTGNSLGLFTVNTALHSNSQSTATPWLGTGNWRPAGNEEPVKVAHADPTPVGIDDADAPPRLSHDTSKQNASAPAPDSGKDKRSGSSSAPASGSSKSSTGSSSGDEPPRLSKPSAPSSPSADSQSSPEPPGAPSKDSKSNPAKPDTASIPASDSGTNEANRPRLRRGKPAESFADEDVPGYSRPGEAHASSSENGKIVPVAAVNPDIKLIPAISDAAGPVPHSFKFEWLKGEEEDRRKQMMDLAKTEVRAYVAAHSATPASPKPKQAAAARRTVPSREPIFENVQMIAFDLWNSNQPVIVLTATAHMPPQPAGTTQANPQSELQYSVCLVTYPDIYNNLHKLYTGITDRFHLDVTPRLDLIDAVDADGDGRGELLFRQTSDIGQGWILYRATGDKLWKMFDSLNPD